MRERLLFAAGALARLVMVVVAFGLAVGSIGLATVRGFCPEVDEALATTLGEVTLATAVEEPAESGPSVDPNAPAPEATDAPGTSGTPAAPGGQQTPSGQQTPGEQTPTEGEQETAGSCPGGAQRCLPPMISSVLIVGDPICHDQAGGRLRGILVPAFVGSTVLLAGAWWLRPSRLQERFGSHATEPTGPRT